MTKTITEKQIRKILENGTEKAAKVCKQKFYDKPKSLTEQWRDNDLADDKLYYWRISDGQELVQNKLGMCAYRLCNDSDKIECLAPVPSYDEYKELVSKTDELMQKVHILNEQNTKQYNELCEEIKKNNILEKKLAIATKALKQYANRRNWVIGNFMCANNGVSFSDAERAEEVLKEIEEF